MRTTLLRSVEKTARSLTHAVAATSLLLAGFAPMLLQGGASAAPQLPNRELQITTARPSQNFDLVFEFDTTAVATDVERIEIEFCTTPLGTCTATPGTNVPTVPATSTVGQANWASATAFGTYTRSGGDNGGTNNQVTVSRTAATSEASVALHTLQQQTKRSMLVCDYTTMHLQVRCSGKVLLHKAQAKPLLLMPAYRKCSPFVLAQQP
jgi:hypothetical protein